MNTKNDLTNGNNNSNQNSSSTSLANSNNFHLSASHHIHQHHNHLHPQHPHQHPNHQHHLIQQQNGVQHNNGGNNNNGLISGGTSTKLNNLVNQSMASAAIALNQYGQQTSLTNNNLLLNSHNNNNLTNLYNSTSVNISNSSSLMNHHNNNNNNNHHSNNNHISNNNSNNNNSNNYNDDYMYRSYQYSAQPQWYDIEIKGMVKNISPKLWQWTHLSRLCLNDNNLVRLPPVVSNLANLQYLDVSNNKIRTLPAEIGDMTSLRELYLNYNQLRVLPFELGKLFKMQQLGLKGNPLTTDIMQIYSEPNGTQKLLISLLDQLSITCSPPPRRPWMILAEPNPALNSCIFTTMCYNVLCDKYATRQYYGYCPAWALAWDYRKKLILDDIKNFNADIIALQELETEQFYQFFLPELKQFDYDGIFSPKSRAKTMSENDKKHVDGCAIFFKTTRFQLVKDYLIEFNQIAMATAEGSEDMLNRVMTKDNIGLAALLEVKLDDVNNTSDIVNSKANGKDGQSSGVSSSSTSSSTTASTPPATTGSSSSSSNSSVNKQLLLVSTAHIHWDPEYCDVKLIQTLMFTNELKAIIEQAAREFQPQKFSNNGNAPIDCSCSIPVVVCADLNSLPDSGVIEYLRTGRILANHNDFKELGYDSCLQKINTSDRPSELSHNLKLDCAYEKDLMPYTNYTYDFKGMIDYIFYSSQLMRTVGLLGPLDIEWIKANKILGFPHPHVPSDHLPLMIELELINPNLNPGSFYQQQQSSSSSSSSSTNINGNANNYLNNNNNSNNNSSPNYLSSSSNNTLSNRSNQHHHQQQSYQQHQNHNFNHNLNGNHNNNNNNGSNNLHHHYLNHQHNHQNSTSSSFSYLLNHQNSMQTSSSSPSSNLNLINSNYNYLRK